MQLNKKEAEIINRVFNNLNRVIEDIDNISIIVTENKNISLDKVTTRDMIRYYDIDMNRLGNKEGYNRCNHELLPTVIIILSKDILRKEIYKEDIENIYLII